MELIVDLARGAVRGLYDEAIALAAIGRVMIERASHVEPDADGCWWADLAPVGGPRLGPYLFRSEALAAERSWLRTYFFASPAPSPSQPV
jgi:hypothetical protein